jgi:hypothetical protein
MFKEVTILLMVVLAAFAVAVPRKYMLVAFVIAACFVPTDQRLVVVGFDFTVLRVLVLAGVFRIVLRGEHRQVAWNKFDVLVLVWALCGAVVFVLQWASFAALVNRMGFLFDVLGLYWIFRQHFASLEEIATSVRSIAVCGLVLSGLVAIEWSTGSNPFAFLGNTITNVREGRVRCQASFPHAIMLGLFWANMVPLFAGFLLLEKKRLLLIAGIAAAVFIVVASASSTPVMTLMQIGLLLACYRFRRYSTVAFWCIVGMLFSLHFVMNHPVWHLICRVNVFSGSTGWYRYYLIDQAIKHIGEWVVLGTRSTEHWGYGLGDVTNQYILEGVRGGLVTLVLFVVMLSTGVTMLVKLSNSITSPGERWLAWSIFSALLGHCVSFLGVSYFGQITMLLYFTLAMVGASYDLFRGHQSHEYRRSTSQAQPMAAE